MRPAQFFLRAPLGAAHLGFAQFPFHRWHQPRQALFHHVSVGSGPACMASEVSTISEAGLKPPRSKARSNNAASNSESSTTSTRSARRGSLASATFAFVLISQF